MPFVKSLRLDVAVRYDDYDDFGSTTNPKVTLQWIPEEQVSLHGSYATSFKVPTLYDLVPNQPSAGYIYYLNPANPADGNALEINYQQNPNLRPETAVTYDAGATFTPHLLPGLSLSGSYFSIDYRNKIEAPCNTFCFTDLLSGQAGDFLNTSPTLAEVNSALSVPNRSILCFVATCSASSIKSIANLGIVNAAVVQVRGLDFDGKYVQDTEIGQLRLDADGSYFLSYTERVTPSASSTSGYGRVGTPPRFRMRIDFGWSNGPWTADARLNLQSGEKNQYDTSCSVDGCPVTSWTTFDLSASYAFEDLSDARFLNGTRINFSIQNLFNRAPPFIVDGNNTGYDPVNANPLGRTFAIALTKRW